MPNLIIKARHQTEVFPNAGGGITIEQLQEGMGDQGESLLVRVMFPPEDIDQICEFLQVAKLHVVPSEDGNDD